MVIDTSKNADIYDSIYQSENKALKAIDTSKTDFTNTIYKGLDDAANYLSPYMDAGNQATTNYMNASTPEGMANFQGGPGFDWRMDQLGKHVNQDLAMKGKLNSDMGAVNYMAPALNNALMDEYQMYMDSQYKPMEMGASAAQSMAGNQVDATTALGGLEGQAGGMYADAINQGTQNTISAGGLDVQQQQVGIDVMSNQLKEATVTGTYLGEDTLDKMKLDADKAVSDAYLVLDKEKNTMTQLQIDLETKRIANLEKETNANIAHQKLMGSLETAKATGTYMGGDTLDRMKLDADKVVSDAKLKLEGDRNTMTGLQIDNETARIDLLEQELNYDINSTAANNLLSAINTGNVNIEDLTEGDRDALVYAGIPKSLEFTSAADLAQKADQLNNLWKGVMDGTIKGTDSILNRLAEVYGTEDTSAISPPNLQDQIMEAYWMNRIANPKDSMGLDDLNKILEGMDLEKVEAGQVLEDDGYLSSIFSNTRLGKDDSELRLLMENSGFDMPSGSNKDINMTPKNKQLFLDLYGSDSEFKAYIDQNYPMN